MSSTEPSSSQDDEALPFARPPRRETFLARIPRWKKLAATAALFALALAPVYWPESGPAKPKPLTPHQIEEAKLEAKLKKLDDLQKPGAPLPGKDAEQNAEAPVSNSPEVAPSAAAPSGGATPPASVSGGQAEAMAQNDDWARKPLAHAPDPELTDPTKDGDLPRIAVSGRTVWQAYARPFNHQDPRPKIAIVVMGLGFSRVATDATLERTPPPVTLVFDVQSKAVADWLQRARQDGHETMLDVPMEPFDYPNSDPGPNTLLTNLTPRDITERFLWALRQGAGYVGVTSDSGSRFSANPDKAKLFLDVVQHRGLMIFDPRVSPHSVLKDLALQMRIPNASATRRIDDDPTPASLDAALREIEQTARLQGQAVAIVSPLPLSLEKLQAWIKTLPAKGFALAPLSAVAGG